jgi:hypothetical protein
MTSSGAHHIIYKLGDQQQQKKSLSFFVNFEINKSPSDKISPINGFIE